MTQQTKSLADLLPAQEHYYVLHDGVKFARHGTPEAIGLLVFEDRERADRFCQTVGTALPNFRPLRVDAEEFTQLLEEIGAVCVVDGLKVVVAKLRPRKSKSDTQTGSGPLPANPEGVVPGNPHWLPADQIPAFVEAQLDDDVLPCGCPVDPLEIEEARASRIEELRVATWDDRDDVCEILEGGPTDSDNRSSADIELRATPAPLSPTEGRTFPEYVPDALDMEMLAWAYLDEGISLAMHSFTTGWSEKYWHRFQRFELIVKHLGESKRREIIDAMDVHQARHRADDWQVFKAWCEPGFWSTPADRAAVLRVADSLPEHMSDTEADRCGHEYLEILRGAQKERATNLTSGTTNPEGVVPEDSNWEPAK